MKFNPLKIFCFPWRLHQRLELQDELNKDLQRRIQMLEDEIRATHPDLQRRIQVLEDEIRATHPDLQRRIQVVEDEIRTTHPDLQRRIQVVEDEIRTTHPDLQRRIFAVEQNIREKLLNVPAYRDVSAKKLPAHCSCKKILGKTTVSAEKSRILVDVSQLLVTNGRSGIQRVVIRILDAMIEDSRMLYVPVGLCKGKMYYVEYHQDEGAFYIGNPLTVMPSDRLLMLDSSWEYSDFFAKTFAQVHAAGGKIYFIVHDLIPILQPQYVTDVMASVYSNWMEDSILYADGMLCASKTVAEQLRNYLVQNGMQYQANPLEIGHFVEGADFLDEPDQETDPKLAEIFALVKGKKKFLSVSTIEPRKNHNFMLDVMEKLWNSGHDVAYFIVGKQGWNADSVVERIKNHPELNKRLFWFNFIEDNELQQIYRESDILLNLSHGEGFGLPLVEGAHYQCSIAASDIPVFHEVITDDTTLFCNIDSLDETVEAIAKKLSENSFVPSKAKYYLWRDALSSMLRCILDNKWDFELSKNKIHYSA